jgi:hypothetical protein
LIGDIERWIAPKKAARREPKADLFGRADIPAL